MRCSLRDLQVHVLSEIAKGSIDKCQVHPSVVDSRQICECAIVNGGVQYGCIDKCEVDKSDIDKRSIKEHNRTVGHKWSDCAYILECIQSCLIHPLSRGQRDVVEDRVHHCDVNKCYVQAGCVHKRDVIESNIVKGDIDKRGVDNAVVNSRQ